MLRLSASDLMFSHRWRCHCWSPVLLRSVDLLEDIIVSEEYTDSIFRTKDIGSMFFQKDDIYIQLDTVLQSRRPTAKSCLSKH